MDTNRSVSHHRQNWRPSQQDAPALYKPCIVGYFSVDVSRNYCPDLSQVKFITHIPQGKIAWDLNHNIDQAVKRTTDDNFEKLDMLLKFLLDHDSKFNLGQGTYITYRSTMISIMYSAFNITEPICIRACLYKNNIYLREMPSELELKSRQTCSDFEKRCTAWGYKFEQYMSSDQPNLAPNIDRPVIENEEFSLVYCSQLGGHKLFYGAQTDGLLATRSTSPIPNTLDLQENVNYLRNNRYLELKTNREILNPRQESNFKKYKMLRCWLQCYLANYEGLCVGFRNDTGIVKRLRWFDTAEIVEYCKREWDLFRPICGLEENSKKLFSSVYLAKCYNIFKRCYSYEIVERSDVQTDF